MHMESLNLIKQLTAASLNSLLIMISFENSNYLSLIVTLTYVVSIRYGSLFFLENINENFMNFVLILFLACLVKMADLIAFHWLK